MGVDVINSLKKVSVKNHEYTVTKEDFNVAPKSKLVATETSLYIGANFTAKKIYHVLGNTYVYGSDWKLYLITYYNATAVVERNFYTPPILLVVKVNGQDDVLVIDSDYAYLLNAKKRVSIVFGQNYLFHAGRLFVSVGRELYISKPFPFDIDEEMTASGDGIFTEKNYGDIIGLVGGQNQVLIFTRSAIFTLSTIGDCFDFSLKKVVSPYLDIESGSVKKIGDFVYFYCKGDVFEYKNGRVEKFVSLPQKHYVTTYIAMCEYYVIGDESNTGLTAVNVLTKEIFQLKYYTDIAENGYAVSGKKVYVISLSNEDENASLGINELTLSMDSAGVKAITKIDVLISSPCMMRIKGDFGEREYYFMQSNRIVCNLVSRTYQITILDSLPEKIVITYRIYGE